MQEKQKSYGYVSLVGRVNFGHIERMSVVGFESGEEEGRTGNSHSEQIVNLKLELQHHGHVDRLENSDDGIHLVIDQHSQGGAVVGASSLFPIHVVEIVIDYLKHKY